MHYNLIKIIILINITFISICAHAWNAPAHQLIAEIAYQNLSPKAKKESVRLVNVLAPYYGKTHFNRVASWADELRGHDVNAFATWHYIDMYFSQDKTRLPKREKHNVVWAIRQAEIVLASDNSNDIDKALFIRMLIHFVGDVHQPLHCVSRVSKKKPRGDMGGNLVSVRYKGSRINLHTVWDRGLGVFSKNIKRGKKRWPSLIEYAEKLQQRYPKKRFAKQLSKRDPQQWARESHLLAKRIAYNFEVGQELNQKYIKQAQKISEQRVALAGYRLAHDLNKLLS